MSTYLNSGPIAESEEEAALLAQLSNAAHQSDVSRIPKLIRDALKTKSGFGRPIAELIVGNEVYRLVKGRAGFRACKITMPDPSLTGKELWAAMANAPAEYCAIGDIPERPFAEWSLRFQEYERVGTAASKPSQAIQLNQSRELDWLLQQESDPEPGDNSSALVGDRKYEMLHPPSPAKISQVPILKTKVCYGWKVGDDAIANYEPVTITKLNDTTCLVEGQSGKTYRIAYRALVFPAICKMCKGKFHPRNLTQDGHCYVCKPRCPDCIQERKDAETAARRRRIEKGLADNGFSGRNNNKPQGNLRGTGKVG